MSEVHVRDDVIRFDGYDVARLADNIPATVRGRFVDAIDGIEITSEGATLESGHLDNILDFAKEKAKAGMVTVKELEKFLESLKGKPAL